MTELDPNYLFTEIFHWFFNRWYLIETFRKFSNLGTQSALRKIYTEQTELTFRLEKDPEYARFVDQKKLGETFTPEGRDKFIADAVNRQLSVFKVLVDTTSLILAHSILETSALDLIKITSIVDHPKWAEHLSERKVSIKEIKSLTFEKCFDNLVKKRISELERESLLSKIDFLHSFCPPPDGELALKNYRYDCARMKKLDKLRHDNVHGRSQLEALPEGEDDLEYLEKTFLYLFSLVNNRYGLKINPNYSAEIMKNLT